MATAERITKKDEIRALAEQDLETFIRLVHPQRLLGGIHQELIQWWNRPDAKSHQLVLLPRDHAKSAMVAYRVAHAITRDPTIRVLYLSSTANLAIKQLKFIKDILTSSIYKFYWPEMLTKEESKREKWSETEIAVDHPLRKKEAIRDPTVFTAGLTTTVTGLHFDIIVLDDVVVMENAYTNDGRNKTKQQYSLLASIGSGDAEEWVVGTRYFPEDLYYDLQAIEVDQFNEYGEVVNTEPLYEIFERKVENIGDGTGEFLWPRQQRYDGKWFGFSQEILAIKRAQYLDATQYRAQYYNDPNDPSGGTYNYADFIYYDRENVKRIGGRWFHRGERINVFASIDFAFSLSAKADYTSIAVVGVDAERNYYVLDIDRFKTDDIAVYFKHILALHRKWDFRKLRAEATSAQATIIKSLRQNHIQKHGLALSIDDYTPTRWDGAKEERVQATLRPLYDNGQIFHYQGGNCQTLEEELILSKPTHDDVKDAVSCAIDICQPPSPMRNSSATSLRRLPELTHSRFGGIA